MKELTFEKMEPTYFPEWGFRPHTQCIPMDMNFVFLNGGFGDYVCWMQAIRWLSRKATWIKGTLIHPTYFNELAEYWLKGTGWQHKDYKNLDQIPNADDKPFRGPVMLQNESLNATGAHLFTCGWAYFTNKERAPKGWNNYPHLKQRDLDKIGLPEVLRGKRYAVITTGVTTESRRVKPEYWNHVIEHVVQRGLTPVFLGRSVTETGNARNIHTEYGRELKLDLGTNLIDQTTFMQAAAIMSRAQVVIGHDNGLLHLAGCTSVPIVFGYNLASPEHRRPLRRIGRIYDVTLTERDLACNHCQSRVNFVIGFNFRSCMYGDLKCMDILFENKAERWKTAIDQALEDSLTWRLQNISGLP